MALEQQVYYRTDRSADPTFRGVHPLSVTAWLIIINVACFLLDCATTHYLTFSNGSRIQLGPGPVYQLGVFTVNAAVFHFQVWRFITFQFLHANLTHLAFNMLALFFFGPLMESYLGRARYLAFYLLCGAAGPMSYLLFYGLHVAAESQNSGLIGASAGVFGVLIAASQVLPNAKVLIYGIIPARLRSVAWMLLGIAVYTVFTNGRNAGGEAAHLGGAALGYLLIKNERWLDVFGPRGR
jgi:membrane associated rhomboid family serine protease